MLIAVTFKKGKCSDVRNEKEFCMKRPIAISIDESEC